jgi:hypothetical protein
MRPPKTRLLGKQDELFIEDTTAKTPEIKGELSAHLRLLDAEVVIVRVSM